MSKNRKPTTSQTTTEGVKDDGTRWIVVSEQTGKPIYGDNPIPKADAVRLAEGLVTPAVIREVEA